MATPLKDRLRSAASGFAGLTALLGTSPFRWYDTQLIQGSVLPAIVVLVVSDPKNYWYGGRMHTSFARVQFTLWDTDPERIETLQNALYTFIDNFNGAGISKSPQGNFVINERDGLFSATQQPQYQRFIDIKIYSNDTV